MKQSDFDQTVMQSKTVGALMQFMNQPKTEAWRGRLKKLNQLYHEMTGRHAKRSGGKQNV